jgi:hypothetical protein
VHLSKMGGFHLLRADFCRNTSNKKSLAPVSVARIISKDNFNGNFFPEASRSGEEVDPDRR